MRELAWVLGASGLLGSALVRALRQGNIDVHQPSTRFSWREVETAKSQLALEADAFGKRAESFHRWTVFWAAGVGSMASQPGALNSEELLLGTLLEALGNHASLRKLPATFVLSSSAGALYGGAPAACYGESSPISPSTPYAESKLRQEQLVDAFATDNRMANGLILRYSTLYGPGQAREKPQGLISQIARRIVANEPANIYVPLDTIRDYLHADDAAMRTVDTLRATREHYGRTTMKIIASEQATSIATLIGIFQRVSDRKPRIVTSASSISSRYARCVQFLSEEPAGKPHAPGRTLLVGIHQILEAERAIRTRSP